MRRVALVLGAARRASASGESRSSWSLRPSTRRLSLVFPCNILHDALGLTRVRLGDYVLPSCLGMPPGTLQWVYLGSMVTTAASPGADAGPDVPGRQVM